MLHKDRLLKIADDFWNIRGSFRIGGLVNIGTHASLIRRRNGKFLLLDSYAFDRSVKRKIDALTENGARIEAIINLHPFHTIHVPKIAEFYPEARLYGTDRHVQKAPALAWDSLRVTDRAFADRFSDDLLFSIPQGVDFVSDNETVHFSSVLAFHPPSASLHVDDTLMYLRLPATRLTAGVRFHPTLAQALQKRAGAASDFRAWAEGLAEDWGHARNLCAAHNSALLSKEPLRPHLEKALRKCNSVLTAHERSSG